MYNPYIIKLFTTNNLYSIYLVSILNHNPKRMSIVIFAFQRPSRARRKLDSGLQKTTRKAGPSILKKRGSW